MIIKLWFRNIFHPLKKLILLRFKDYFLHAKFITKANPNPQNFDSKHQHHPIPILLKYSRVRLAIGSGLSKGAGYRSCSTIA